MSFPWINHIALLGDGIKLLSIPDGKPGDAVVARAGGDLLQSFDTLLGAAPRGKFRRLDTLTVLAGFPHVHYTVLPWQDALVRLDERKAYARGLLIEHYDLPDDDWLVWLEENDFGQPSLAAAITPAVAQALAAIASQHRLRFVAFRPLMAHVLLHHHKKLPADTLLAIPEGLACSFALRRGGQWADAFTLRFPHRDLEKQIVTAWAILRRLPGTLHVAARKPAHPGGLLSNAQWLSVAEPQEVPRAAA